MSPKLPRVVRALLALGFRADPPRMVALFGATVMGQIAILATTYSFKLLVDAAVQRSLPRVLAAASMGAGAQVITMFCGRAYVKLGITVEEKSIHALDRHLIRLTAGVPTLDHHERPAYMDELSLLRADRSLIGQMANARRVVRASGPRLSLSPARANQIFRASYVSSAWLGGGAPIIWISPEGGR